MIYEINDDDLNRLEGYARMGEVFRFLSWKRWLQDNPRRFGSKNAADDRCNSCPLVIERVEERL